MSFIGEPDPTSLGHAPVDLNAGQAALRAGYANGDVANARVAGHRLRRRKLHLRARVGAFSVLHTWGSALTHHPHVAHDRAGRRILDRWQQLDLMPTELHLPVRVLSRLFRRLFAGQAPR